MRLIPSLFLSLLFISASSALWAATDGKATASAIYPDGGNRSTTIHTPFNTSVPVLISSAPTNWKDPTGKNTFKIQVWRSREIINCSNGRMMIVDNNKDFTTFLDTFGVVLGTDTSNITGNFHGDSYIVPHQGEVWAIWGAEATSGGACGSESFWDPTRGAAVKP